MSVLAERLFDQRLVLGRLVIRAVVLGLVELAQDAAEGVEEAQVRLRRCGVVAHDLELGLDGDPAPDVVIADPGLEEVAETLGCSLGAGKALIARGMESLRRNLEGNEA